MLRPGCPGAGAWRRMGQIRARRNLRFCHRAEQDRPLSGRDRQCFLRWPPRRHRHDVSILTATMVRGAAPGAKRSTRIMRPPQHGHGGRWSSRGSSAWAQPFASCSWGAAAGIGAAMICLMRAMVSAIVRRCVEEDRDMIRRQTMMTQLLAQPRRMGGNGLLHHVQALNAARKTSRDGAALPGWRHALQVDARRSPKLMDDALTDDSQALPGELGIEPGDVGGGPTPEGGELGLARAADAPDILEIDQR